MYSQSAVIVQYTRSLVRNCNLNATKLIKNSNCVRTYSAETVVHLTRLSGSGIEYERAHFSVLYPSAIPLFHCFTNINGRTRKFMEEITVFIQLALLIPELFTPDIL